MYKRQALFIVTMANANRRPAAIFGALAAIAHRHTEAKLDNPASFSHEAVLKAWDAVKPKAATFVPSSAAVRSQPTETNIGVAN